MKSAENNNDWIKEFDKIVSFLQALVWTWKALVWFYQKILPKLFLWIFKIFGKLFLEEKKPWRNTQEYIDKKFPLHKRKGITELLLQNLRLKGPLSLKGFVDLTVINCRHNRITSLDLSDCKKLRKLYCDDNQRIRDLDLSNLPNLEWLDVCDNRFTNLNFLNTIPRPEKLQGLVVCNNSFASPLNLKNLFCFSNLEILVTHNHN